MGATNNASAISRATTSTMVSLRWILLSRPQVVLSFITSHYYYTYTHNRPSAAQPAAAPPLPYSFRHPPDDDNAAFSSDAIDAGTNGELMDDDEIDIVGPGTLGDIMSGSSQDDLITFLQSNATPIPGANNHYQQSSSSDVIDGLVTKEGGELNKRFNCNFTPMERIALTSNGNLQRIFSSYYDAPVHVHIDFCERRVTSPSSTRTAAKLTSNTTTLFTNDNREDSAPNEMNANYIKRYPFPDFEINGENNNNTAIWDRVVHIHIHGQTICKATSIISVKDSTCIDLIENGTIGLGQLFRYLNRLPTFSLVNAGRSTSFPSSDRDNTTECDDMTRFEGGMWRIYELKCEEMTCLIQEEFHKDAWNISVDKM